MCKTYNVYTYIVQYVGSVTGIYYTLFVLLYGEVYTKAKQVCVDSSTATVHNYDESYVGPSVFIWFLCA